MGRGRKKSTGNQQEKNTENQQRKARKNPCFSYAAMSVYIATAEIIMKIAQRETT